MSVEARRLAVLCAHLNPTRFHPDPPTPLGSVAGSVCAANSDTENHNLQNDCVFCKIIRGQSPALKLYEDDMCLCILDISPLSHGHSLIIPKSHFPSLDATPPSVVAAMCSKVPFISNAILKATGCRCLEFCRFIQPVGQQWGSCWPSNISYSYSHNSP